MNERTAIAAPVASPAAVRPRVNRRELWLRRLAGPLGAAGALALFWVFLLSSVREKSLTSDETAHAVAGYTYWKYNDYRLNPENGNLPQRLMALPLLGSDFHPPPRDHEAWRFSDEWTMGDVWFHQLGNDLDAMLFRGRAAIATVTAVLGALVWLWSRKLFGTPGAWVSLALFVASPTILANGALMTSEATCALFFLAAVGAFWRLLQRVTIGRVLASGLLAGAMFVSKMSAVLLLPIAALLLIARIWAGGPLVVGGGSGNNAGGRRRAALALIGAVAAHGVLVPVVIWACYGFRFSAFAPSASPEERFQHPWDYVLEKPELGVHLAALSLTPAQHTQVNAVLGRFDLAHEGRAAADALKASVLTRAQAELLDAKLNAPPTAFAARVFAFLHHHRILPEAYIYGYAHAWRFARMRSAFFNGEYGVTGWKTFFPYTFLVKTPLPVFGVAVLALLAAMSHCRRRAMERGTAFGREVGTSLYATLPLWTLLAVYWAAVIPSRLNIGHRHILVTYPPLFVLCGAAGYWLHAWRSRTGQTEFVRSMPFGPKFWAAAVGLLLAGLAAEVAYRYPHYLAYFNGVVQPRHAYRHLVDSSLDWGQDLPGLKRFLDRRGSASPVYLSYFGTARPESYGITAHYLYSAAGLDLPRTPVRELHTTKAQLERELAEARRRWIDCELVARADFDDENVALVFLRKPALPELTPGTYCVSATMLQAIFYGFDGPLGHWNERFEARYRELRREIEPLLAAEPDKRSAAFIRKAPDEWTRIFESFAQFRFARLTAYLRQREPDAHVGYSILIYQLDASDLAEALDGPPPELGEDLPARLAERGIL